MDELTKQRREELLRDLYLTFQHADLEAARLIGDAYRSYKASEGRDSDYRAVIDVLSRVEHMPGLATDCWELVVLAKAVLGGREGAEEKFEHAARRVAGVM